MSDKKPQTPLYLQVAALIKENLETNDFSVGDRLPFESWYMDQYSVSRVTVRRAIDELIAEGIVERHPHKGLFVSEKKIHINQPNSPIYEYNFDNSSVSSKMISFDTIEPSSKLKKVFSQNEKTPERLYFFRTLRYTNGTPFALQSIFMNADLMPDLDIFILKDHPIYDIIENIYGLNISHIDVQMSVTVPTDEQSDLLEIPHNEHLLRATDNLFLSTGDIIRHTVSIYTKASNYTYTLYK